MSSKTWWMIAVVLVMAVCLTACETPAVVPVALASTATPDAAVSGKWVKGHFWSIKLINVQVASTLDGQRPKEDKFVVVEVDWKANDLAEMHTISGIDFELVDTHDTRYVFDGMIYRPGNLNEPQGPGEKFNRGGYRTNEARSDAMDTYKVVFDVPASAQGLKLWFQDLPLIDLGLSELP
jgi:hypothetical protein